VQTHTFPHKKPGLQVEAYPQPVDCITRDLSYLGQGAAWGKVRCDKGLGVGTHIPCPYSVPSPSHLI